MYTQEGAWRRGGPREVMEKKRILVVDDNEFFIQQQVDCLGRSRFEIHTALSGMEGIEKTQSLLPDLVLLDMFMEDMNGPQVAGIIKGNKSTSHIPVVIVSSGEIELSTMESAVAYCDGILFKPIRRDLLINMVEALLGMIVRRWNRMTTSIPCTIIFQGKETPGMIHSIGGGGAFVEGGLFLMRGDVCRLRCNLPGTERSIEVYSAAVVWKGKEDGGEAEGVGLSFLSVAESDRKSLEEYAGAIHELDEREITVKKGIK